MDDPSELFTIGQLSRSTGVSVKTIRFWSDLGLLPPVERTDGGYRLYDAASAARLDLIRTLRGLGIDLDTVSEIVEGRDELADVAREHVRALDAEIRILELRRAVLRWVAAHGSTQEEMRLMHDLTMLSAQERQQIIDDFVDETFSGTEAAPHIAKAMKAMRGELPAEPTSEQMEAWVELAGLVTDPAFKRRVREMAEAGSQEDVEETSKRWQQEVSLILEHVPPAMEAGLAPDSPQGQDVVARIVRPDLGREERLAIADRIAMFNDRRVERYWQLMGILNGTPPFPAQSPIYDWFVQALRA